MSNKNTWIQSVHHNEYSFIYKRICFCRHSGKEILIKATDEAIKSATIDNASINTNTLPTMRQLFELIFESLKIQERKGDLTISAEYNEKHGNPELIVIKRPGADGVSTIHIKEVQIRHGN